MLCFIKLFSGFAVHMIGTFYCYSAVAILKYIDLLNMLYILLEVYFRLSLSVFWRFAVSFQFSAENNCFPTSFGYCPHNHILISSAIFICFAKEKKWLLQLWITVNKKRNCKLTQELHNFSSTMQLTTRHDSWWFG